MFLSFAPQALYADAFSIFRLLINKQDWNPLVQFLETLLKLPLKFDGTFPHFISEHVLLTFGIYVYTYLSQIYASGILSSFQGFGNHNTSRTFRRFLCYCNKSFTILNFAVIRSFNHFVYISRDMPNIIYQSFDLWIYYSFLYTLEPYNTRSRGVRNINTGYMNQYTYP